MSASADEVEDVPVRAVRAQSSADEAGVEVSILVGERWVSLGAMGEGGGSAEWTAAGLRAAIDAAARRERRKGR